MSTGLCHPKVVRSSLVLAAALWAAALWATPLGAQEVVMVVGSGLSPGSLREGSRPPRGTVIVADPQTIVVLMNKRRLKQDFCEEWVILRGASYQVETSASDACPTRGSGNELQRAMNGEHMRAHLTARVMFADDPKADAPYPKNLSQLRGDVGRAKRDRPAVKPGGPVHVPPPIGSSQKHGQIQARYSRAQCLHRQYDSSQNGNPIHLWECNAGPASMSTWIYDEQTGYIRSAAAPNMCWHKERLDWINGNRIHLWNCSEGGPEQKTWTYDRQTGQIRARTNPAKCIHKRDGGFSNGNPVHLWDCAAGVPEFKSWYVGVQ